MLSSLFCSAPATPIVVALPLETKADASPVVVTSSHESKLQRVEIVRKMPTRSFIDIRHALEQPEFLERLAADSTLKDMMIGFFSPGKIYKFRMTAALGNVSTSVGSVLNTTIVSFSPSITSYTQWSALSNLFDEVKLIKARMIWNSRMTSLSTASSPVFAVAPVTIYTSTSPSNIDDVLAREDCYVVNAFDRGTSVHRFDFKTPANRYWASTTSPAPLSPPSGMAGGFWCMVDSAVASASTSYFTSFLEVEVAFRIIA